MDVRYRYNMLKSPGIAGYYGTEEGAKNMVLTTCKTGYYKFSGHKYSDKCMECPPGKGKYPNRIIASFYKLCFTLNCIFLTRISESVNLMSGYSVSDKYTAKTWKKSIWLNGIGNHLCKGKI